MWIDAIKVIKREIMFFPAMINWELNQTASGMAFKKIYPFERYSDPETQIANLHPSLIYLQNDKPLTNFPSFLCSSSESSLLESINFILESYNKGCPKGYTGNMILIISAGTGLYFTNQPLAKVAKLQVLSEGVTATIMSMKRPPMHSYPLFIYDRELFEQEYLKANPKEEENRMTLFYSKQKEKPNWLHVHFFFSFMQLEGTCNLQSPIHTQIHERPKKFHQLFRLPIINSAAIPHIKPSVSLEIKYDPNDLPKTIRGMKFQLQLHDTKIFISKDHSLLADDIPRLRKGTSAEKLHEGIKDRKDSFNVTRRESLVESDRKRDSLVSNQSIHHQAKKKYSSLKRRWADCYKVIKDYPEEYLKDDNKINDKRALEYYESVWSSLLEPCLLPLFNDFWPQQKDIGVSQPFHSYVSNKVTREQAINNLIGSRLDRGFQMVKKNAIDGFGGKIIQPEVALSLGAAYHEIIPDRNDEFSIDYMVHCPKAVSIQAIAKVTAFNMENNKYQEKEHAFTFTYPATWDDSDSKMFGY